MMVFCPYYENSMLGGNVLGTPQLPIVSDDAGTPFAVVLIPIDSQLRRGCSPRARST